MAKQKKMKVRNFLAIDAQFRQAGPMKDRRKERGGARNLQREYLAEAGR